MQRGARSSRNLINAQFGVPDGVQIFDISDNGISELESTAFWQLRHLRQLRANSNAIQSISLDAFRGLPLLQNISLADNRLAAFDARVFEAATRLEWLDLSGNAFMSIRPDVAMLRSESLRVLLLARAEISFVSAAMLSAVPALERLDLSDNLLITLHVDAFARTVGLKELRVVNNPFNCDANMQRALERLQRRAVEVVNYDCGRFKSILFNNIGR